MPAVGFLPEPPSVRDVDVGGGAHPLAHLVLGQLEGGRPSGISVVCHVTYPVRSALEWLHSAQDESSHEIACLQSFLVQFTHSAGHPIQIGVAVADLDAPVGFMVRRI